jgi:hypothetical protein
MKLFDDHAFLLFLALLAILASYVVVVLCGKPVDERIIGLGFVVVIGALAGRADSRK